MIKLIFMETESPEAQALLNNQVCNVLKDFFDEEIMSYVFGFGKDPNTLADDEHFGQYETKCYHGIKTITAQQKAMFFMQASQFLRDEELHELSIVHKIIYLNLANYFQKRYRRTISLSINDPVINRPSHEFVVNSNGDILVKRIKFPKTVYIKLYELLIKEHNTKKPYEISSMLKKYEYIDCVYDTLKACLPLDTSAECK